MMNLLIAISMTLILKPTSQQPPTLARLASATGGSGQILACTFDFTNIRLICASSINPYQLSYIPVTSPYTRVYDTMSSTNHGVVNSMQYHVLSDNSQVIYMAASNRMVRYNSQVPTVITARVQTHFFATVGTVSSCRVNKEGTFWAAGMLDRLSRCSPLMSCADLIITGGTINNILNRLTGNHMVVLSQATNSIMINLDLTSLSVIYQFTLTSITAHLMTISQTDNDIVYIGTSAPTTLTVRSVRFVGATGNSVVSSVTTTSVSTNLHVILSSKLLIVAETTRIYLIDLDNFAAGAIASTIVNIASGTYTSRSLSIDMRTVNNEAVFILGTANC